ncbi:hypothetical protein [Streptomyces sp. MP131-18]|uniref:hypothetical protein n=1 Tax=Streptomyces sp. MP131-18 TaxID=1857892 RepID=UPI00097C05C9|nr:hypothetical protein [Streptomyces sp. MP131-18]ONK13084.1 hypothetical protein STBA_38460 [Streptomyces sp. MP131-18]
MGLKETATREAVLKVVTDLVTQTYSDARGDTQQALDKAHAELGVDRIRLELPDGTALATTSRTSPKQEARVTDPEAFLAWVRTAYPSEVVTRTITEARKSFTDRLLKEMSKTGAPELADGETGEVHEVPGVTVATWREPGHAIRLADGAEQAVADAWRSGQLAHLGLPELSTGEAQ